MTREEAITVLENIKMDLEHYRDLFMYSNDINSVIERLRDPITLADFLGWEEDVEYKKGGNVCMVSGGELYIKYIDEDDWYKVGYSWNESNVEEFRNCKKVEQKETKEELLDELQKLVSSERINEIIKKLRRLGDE